MKLDNGKITILAEKKGVFIELYDSDSCISFIDIKLTSEQFTTALSRMGHTPCTIEYRGLDLIGKRMYHKDFEFEMPVDYDSTYRDEIVVSRAKKLCPEGWEPDLSFSSRDSFFIKDGKSYARTTIRKWE